MHTECKKHVPKIRLIFPPGIQPCGFDAPEIPSRNLVLVTVTARLLSEAGRSADPDQNGTKMVRR